MATSGTATFDLDIADLIEEAYERAGTEVRSGYDLRTARRSLNLLSNEWSNRGVNFWTIEETTVAVTASDSDIVLESDTIDVLDASWRTGTGTDQQDRILTRMSVNEWNATANKNTTSLPSRYWINRTLTPTMYLWPVPVDAGTLVYYKMRRIEDSGAYTNTFDIPPRFLPALVSGLAFYLAQKKPELVNRLSFLKQEYEEQYRLASEEDRERASLRLVPRIR